MTTTVVVEAAPEEVPGPTIVLDEITTTATSATFRVTTANVVLEGSDIIERTLVVVRIRGPQVEVVPVNTSGFVTFDGLDQNSLYFITGRITLGDGTVIASTTATFRTDKVEETVFPSITSLRSTSTAWNASSVRANLDLGQDEDGNLYAASISWRGRLVGPGNVFGPGAVSRVASTSVTHRFGTE